MKEVLLKPLVYGTALLLLFFGFMHLIRPFAFILFFPESAPLKLKLLLIYFSGGFEILLGYVFLIPGSRFYAAHFIMRLMVAYLLLHIWQLVSDRRGDTLSIGSRIIIQLIFLYVVYWIRKQTALNNRRVRQYYNGRRIFSRN
jgi:uncharacterized membrane protein